MRERKGRAASRAAIGNSWAERVASKPKVSFQVTCASRGDCIPGSQSYKKDRGLVPLRSRPVWTASLVRGHHEGPWP